MDDRVLPMTNRIGEFLMQIGVMFQFQVDDVVRLQAAGDKRKFGEIAKALGYLVDDEPIRRFLEYQAQQGNPGNEKAGAPPEGETPATD